MYINFEEIRKQNIDKDTLINIIEVIYQELKANKYPNIKINELCKLEELSTYSYKLHLNNVPVSINDIFIVTDSGIVIPPKNISDIEKNIITINNKNIKKTDDIFVTYKY